MNLTYFEDTRTLYIQLSDYPVVATHEATEDFILDTDSCNQLQALTFEQIHPSDIFALWDDKAKVWVTAATKIPGLVIEADTVSAYLEEVKLALPDILLQRKI